MIWRELANRLLEVLDFCVSKYWKNEKEVCLLLINLLQIVLSLKKRAI
jgi:hypothetical protein